jgi:beta-galactosidase
MIAVYGGVRELISYILLLSVYQQIAEAFTIGKTGPGRERLSLNEGWRFLRTTENPDNLIYDRRPDLVVENSTTILKPWILPSGNDFINGPANHRQRPAGNPGGNFSYVQKSFDDSSWEIVNLPHDWAIKGPFYSGANAVVGGGMGRLPVQGVGWYRQNLTRLSADEGRSIYLEIDGAMSYAMVWLNGNLVGGWPYGYNSFRLDLTQYLNPGNDNELAIRLDNPTDSSRWYPGGGIYRNVWLTKVDPIHVAQYGTFITTRNVSAQEATVDITVQVENKGLSAGDVAIATEVHTANSATGAGDKVAEFSRQLLTLGKGEKRLLNNSVAIPNPRLWGPLSTNQVPNLYVAVTHVYSGGIEIDSYETSFGVRSLAYDANNGLLVNGERVKIQGVNQHHDLGAIGAAFNIRAAERQLEILREMGTNAIRTSHNPPAPELLDLTDRMGFLVLDEVFDCWELNKTASDFHLIFDDWHEPDLRAFVRRDRNHPSVIAWSFGNEVGEQYTDVAGAALAQKLHDIVREEDPTRPSTASMNYAKPDMPFPAVMDILALNYQGEGIRDSAAYANLSGIKTPPLYPDFHAKFAGKLLFSSETASAFSSRGTFLFPVTNETSAPVSEGMGGNSLLQQVSAYELYTANFGSSPDKVFAAQDKNPYVAGEFVWSGFDYLGEPTPYDASRSSYSGIIDLAGFPKDRFYLYQSRWRPDHRMAHILPHWTWPNRTELVTPVHVFSAADEAELFLNGQSQGRIRKEAYEYRFRWDEVVYQPGELHVVTYENGTEWANDTVQTAGPAAQLQLIADRKSIQADGRDLSYITVAVLDSKGVVVPQGINSITFSVSGPGEIVATDNGDPASLVPFPSKVRKAYSGLALVIVRAACGGSGAIKISASGDDLTSAYISLETFV